MVLGVVTGNDTFVVADHPAGILCCRVRTNKRPPGTGVGVAVGSRKTKAFTPCLAVAVGWPQGSAKALGCWDHKARPVLRDRLVN